jgi:hypothetical protein
MRLQQAQRLALRGDGLQPRPVACRMVVGPGMGPVKDRVEQCPVHDRGAEQAAVLLQRARQGHQPQMILAPDAAGLSHQRRLGRGVVTDGHEQAGGGHRLAVAHGELAHLLQDRGL